MRKTGLAVGVRGKRRKAGPSLAALSLAALSLAALPFVPISACGMDMPPGMKMPGMNMQAGVTSTQVAGNYRIELNVLPPEPFYTAADASARHVKQGMLVTGGATPVEPTDSPPPNHHLIVHAFDRGSHALVDARVTLSFRPVDATGRPTGDSVAVPVVVMQAIGSGPSSTHYGNNVVMGPGVYDVTVTVNGTAATFRIKVS